jgi:tetratricopeptide (TPR) repeat protein
MAPALLDSQDATGDACRPLIRELANVAGAACGDVILLSEQTATLGTSSATDAPAANAGEKIAADAGAERTELPWANFHRSPEMIAAARRASRRVRDGFARAARGAHYSARSEFVAALQTIAQASDIERGTRHYTRALELGLAALDESADFLGRNAAAGEAPVQQIVLRHQTQLLKDVDLQDLSAYVAAERYCAFAQEQLAAAAFGEVSGSMALFGLAKVAHVGITTEPGRAIERRMQAQYLYRAALLAEQNNFCAANELAVLLGETGHLEEARQLLQKSVSVMPHSVTWRNLAAMHDRLGEPQLAQQARAQANLLPQFAAASSSPDVEWVDAASFARLNSSSDAVLPAAPVAQTPTSKSAAPITTAKKPASRFPWNSRR